MKYLIFKLSCIVLLASCTNKQWYDIGQNKHKQDCLKKRGEEYQKCMQQTPKSYEEYEKERRAVIGKSKK